MEKEMTDHIELIKNVIAIEGGARQCAAKMRISVGYIYQITKRERMLSWKVAEKMQEHLGLNAKELMQMQFTEQAAAKIK